MAVLIVPCPHCSQPAKLDSDRLPDQPVSYPCPHCKEKVVADKRVLMQQHAAQQPTAPQTEQSALSRPAAPQGSGPKPIALPPSPVADRQFSRLPTEARFPSGVIFGDDDAVIEEIRSKLAALGAVVQPVDSADNARQMIINENVELCVVVTSGDVTPPHAPIRPLTGLPPAIRRLTYIALVTDNSNTLDGSEAFAHQVNMVLGKQDLAQFEAALYSGVDYHHRLYRPYLQAVEAKNQF